MKTPRILVLDENAEIAQLEHAMFRVHHYNVEVTVDADEALRRLETRRYDVLVLGLPLRVGGRYLLHILAERFPTLLPCSIVVTWQWKDPELLQRCKTAGVFAVVAKPFDVDELSSIVAACVENECRPGVTRWIGIPDSDIPCDEARE